MCWLLAFQDTLILQVQDPFDRFFLGRCLLVTKGPGIDNGQPTSLLMHWAFLFCLIFNFLSRNLEKNSRIPPAVFRARLITFTMVHCFFSPLLLLPNKKIPIRGHCVAGSLHALVSTGLVVVGLEWIRLFAFQPTHEILSHRRTEKSWAVPPSLHGSQQAQLRRYRTPLPYHTLVDPETLRECMQVTSIGAGSTSLEPVPSEWNSVHGSIMHHQSYV